jgi:predicted phage gp36 major capsid-like protein
MSVELIPHLFHTSNNRPSGQRGLYAVWRNGSKVLDPNAFRLLDSP